MIRRFFLATVLAVAVHPVEVHADASRPDAGTVVALVQQFYDQTKTLRAEFDQTRYTRIYDRTDRASGTVVFKKPGKMRWDYAKPNGQIFAADGDRLVIYQPPEEGEKHGQLIERPIAEDQLPAAFAFLMGTGRLAEDFTFRLLDVPEGSFEGGHALQLLPRKPTPHYEQIVFYVRVVEMDGKRAGVIQRVLIIDSSGNRNRFDFKKMKFNRSVEDKRFEFKPPKGTVRVKP